jgi:hypothetical protein
MTSKVRVGYRNTTAALPPPGTSPAGSHVDTVPTMGSAFTPTSSSVSRSTLSPSREGQRPQRRSQRPGSLRAGWIRRRRGMNRWVNPVVITVARRGVVWHPSGGLPVIVVSAADPVGLGREGPGPGAPPSGSGAVEAVVGQQLLDGLGGLTIQLTLPVAGGQTADLRRDPGREAADGAIGVDDDDFRSERVPAPRFPAWYGPRSSACRAAGRPGQTATTQRGRRGARPAGHSRSGSSQAGSG